MSHPAGTRAFGVAHAPDNAALPVPTHSLAAAPFPPGLRLGGASALSVDDVLAGLQARGVSVTAHRDSAALEDRTVVNM